MVETSGNGNASNLINLKRPFNNTRINASDIGTRHSDPKSIIPFGNPVIFDTFTIANLNQESYYARYSISKCFFLIPTSAIHKAVLFEKIATLSILFQ
jgi:hypothetical protein